ncbi:putative disease resistance RPP13-like protein 1 [Ziziphus jujuba]|uniref:Disease resistance RPP13-like protein 1 n=1 Tax=Ziziphus jujuba TaxID=326968 RepID=A0ABM3I1W6_ZIZJJ|nr:putative disease resistance RPP13-like protein 1 [Ziziphus jujuba]XP_048318916.2 putative disease resistance RPP13-like protein 1 [Ziziphus jujuba]
MAGALVGGAFLSAALQVLFDRLAHREILDYLRRKKFNQELHKKLKMMLVSVNAVVNDAEEKQMTNPAVKEWLDELEDAAYRADDLLDEIAADALLNKLEAESTTSTSRQVRKMANLFSDNSHVSDIENRMKEILDQLEFIAKQKDLLGLKVKEGTVGEKPIPRSQTTSLVDESEVFGRDGDKNAIIKLLLSDDDHEGGKKVSVIPIVGLGGIGKTTLAKLVYNDDKVEKHFMLKSWVCVSEEFNICKVTKTILAKLIPTGSNDDSTDLDSLQTRLKKELAGKKFLIVLDDIWNENYNDWKELSLPFNHGAQGSKIIVTTRNKKVADIMSTVPAPYHPELLEDEDCWKLFAKHAFHNIRDSSAHQVLEIFGKEIVKKCNGLPLAAKTLGGLLRSKEDVREWEKILKSEIWDFPDSESKILPVLMLSYHYLPSHLKRCFAFCSIFPKDYEFKRHELTLLWMAENLLQKSENKRMEDVGEEYFSELVSRSFFQRSTAKNSGFVMHDLVHDLARYVSRGYCFTLGYINSKEVVITKVRHLCVVNDIFLERSEFEIHLLESIFQASHLRTLLDLHHGFRVTRLSNALLNGVVLKLKRLRVLSFHSCYNLVELSESIGELKHLRYLDLSSTWIIRLPESICMLYNLEVLNVSDCDVLTELPKDMHHLVSLRHLDISYTNIVEPVDISKLKSLQTLSTFIVGKENGTKIVEVGELSNLHGRFEIKNLQYVATAKDALEAKLMEKKYLEELVLYWNGDTDDSKHEKDVLDKLFPHTSLKRLSIKGYGGTAFPNWLGYGSVLCNILVLNLSDCKFCTCLPPIGQLPSLKNLEIEGLEGVMSVGAEFYYGMKNNGSCMRKAFASLEFLSFVKMSNWEEWCIVDAEDVEVFPRLQRLKIRDCDRLVRIELSHNFPSLTELIIDGDEVVVSSLPRTPVLRELKLGCCEKLKLQDLVLPQTLKSIAIGKRYLRDDINSIEIQNCEKVEFPLHHSLRSSIEIVEIRNSCGSLECFPLDFFPNLRKLIIEGCKNLESLTITKSSDDMIPLSELRIYECPNFISFPCNGRLHAPNLTHLSIRGCQKLKKLPEQMSNLLPSLNSLEISNCPEVESFPEGGLPFNLAQLTVGGCEKLKALPEQMCNLLPSLNSLEIFDCPEVEESFAEVDLPPNLTQLTVGGCKRLKALPEQMFNLLSCLKELQMGDCPEVESFPEVDLPSNLTQLKVSGCKKLKVLPKQMGNHLPSLNFLEISDCPEVESFPEGGLPLNLHRLWVFNCSKLFAQPMKWNLQTLPALTYFEIEDKGGIISESFPEEGLLPSTLTTLNIIGLGSLKRLGEGLQQLTSLKILVIQHCPQLQELPQQGLPTSLETLMIHKCPQLQKLPQQGLPISLNALYIYECPILEERCQWQQGLHWNKISHIPTIEIHEIIPPFTGSIHAFALGISRFG